MYCFACLLLALSGCLSFAYSNDDPLTDSVSAKEVIATYNAAFSKAPQAYVAITGVSDCKKCNR